MGIISLLISVYIIVFSSMSKGVNSVIVILISLLLILKLLSLNTTLIL